MEDNIRFAGLDVHAATIAAAMAEANREVRPWGVIPNRPEAVRKLVRKLGPSRTAESLLRGRALRLRALLAIGRTRGQLRRGGANPDPSQARRAREDRPARRQQAGAQLPSRGPHGGMGTGPSARGVA